jgi:hypothetical protein
VNPADMDPYVAPYVQVRHAIHLLYATSPRSRDGVTDGMDFDLGLNHRFDKQGHRLPLELHGCGCSLCARKERRRLKFWEAR